MHWHEVETRQPQFALAVEGRRNGLRPCRDEDAKEDYIGGTVVAAAGVVAVVFVAAVGVEDVVAAAAFEETAEHSAASGTSVLTAGLRPWETYPPIADSQPEESSSLATV